VSFKKIIPVGFSQWHPSMLWDKNKKINSNLEKRQAGSKKKSLVTGSGLNITLG
jgi:hypothetical protein